MNYFDTYFVGIYYSKSITGILTGYKVFCETICFSYKNPIICFTETDNRVRYYYWFFSMHSFTLLTKFLAVTFTLS